MQCNDFRDIADSYLSDELLVETNHDVLRHLKSCATCRSDLAARRQLRYELKTKFTASPELRPPDGFAQTLKIHLRDRAAGRSTMVVPRIAYVGLAATLLIAIGVGLFAVRRWRADQRELAAWMSLTHSATGDHRECALEHKLGATVINLDEAARTYDRAYASLTDRALLQTSLPSGAQLLDAHSCAFGGRRFAHLVIKYHDQAVSIVVTENELNKRAPAPMPGDIAAPFESDSYQIAAFQTARHALFVISSLNEADNLAIARSVSPILQKQLRSAEQPLQAKLFNGRRR
jgi:anti-sigma factor RsiW